MGSPPAGTIPPDAIPPDAILDPRIYRVWRDSLAEIAPGIPETIEALPPFEGAAVRIDGVRWRVDRTAPAGGTIFATPAGDVDDWLSVSLADPGDPAHATVRHLWRNPDGTWSGGPPGPPAEPPPGSGHWVAPTPARLAACPWAPLVVALDLSHGPTMQLAVHLHPEIRELRTVAGLALANPRAWPIMARAAWEAFALSRRPAPNSGEDLA